MNAFFRVFLTLLFVGWPVFARAGALEDLLPQPQEFRSREGQSRGDYARLVFSVTVEEKAAGERLSRQIMELLGEIGIGSPKPAKVAVGKPGSGYKLVVGDRRTKLHLPDWNPPANPSEAYQLHVTPKGMVIGAATERGLFYGLQTLGQLVNGAKIRGEKGIDCLEIRDWPALGMRGYSEDYGRNQMPTMADHKRMIRFLARYKMNTYLWFIEPDHFEYEFDPTIGVDVDRFRFDEIRELVAYAREYHVEIIPTVELLGHMEGLLAHTNYSRLAEVPGQMDLCATSDEAFELVRKIVSEVAPAFESKYFHCGLDESFQIGKGQSAQAVKEKGLDRVMADYYVRMNDLIKSKDKTMMMYADIVLTHPKIMDLLPKDIVMMFWDYMPAERYANLDKLRQAGYATTTLSGLWDWAHLYPPYSFSFRNISVMARQSAEAGALGHFVSSWGDAFYSPAGHNLSELNTYGVAYTGAVSWKPGPITIPGFSRAFAAFHYGKDTAIADALTGLAEYQGKQPFRGDVAYVRKFFEQSPREVFKQLGKRDSEETEFWGQAKATLVSVEKALSSAQPSRNQDHVRSLLLSTRLNLFTARKVLAFRELAAGFGQPAFDKDKHANAIASLAEELEALGREYSAVYLASNRPINMRYLGPRWAEMVDHLRGCAAALRGGEWKAD